MIPQNSMSIVPIVGEFIFPDNLPSSKLKDYELGGIGLNDPSGGLEYQVWTLEYIVDRMFISAPNTPRVQLFVRPNITEIGLAFDQNMRPFVTFMEALEAKFWWYDTQIAQTVFTTLPATSRNPKATLDDKRARQVPFSDIILAYMRGRNLYFRAQRDRYTVEYLLASNIDGDLDRMGMNTKNRLQFRMIPNV